jgi:quinol monooxygenase YgiN
MSVTVIVKISVDPEAFERISQERASDFEAVAAEGRAAGAIHHGFVAGEDEIVIVDEWPSAEAFQAFFTTQPVIAKLMEAAGVRSAPEIAVYRTLETVDKF